MEQTKQKTSLGTPNQSLTYKSKTIKDIKLIRGTKETSLSNFCKLIDVPRPYGSQEVNQLMTFLQQVYFIEPISTRKYRFTKIPKNTQLNIKRQKENNKKPILIKNNSKEIININSRNCYANSGINNYIDYIIYNTELKTGKLIIAQIFKNCELFQQIYSIADHKFKIENTKFIIKSFFYEEFRGRFKNRLDSLKSQGIIFVSYKFVFFNSSNQLKKIDFEELEAMGIIDKIEKKQKIKYEKTFDKSMVKFHLAIEKELNKIKDFQGYSYGYREYIIDKLKPLNIEQSIQNNLKNPLVVENILITYFDITREKLLNKINNTILSTEKGKDYFNLIKKEIKELVKLIKYKKTTMSENQFNIYKYYNDKYKSCEVSKYMIKHAFKIK